MNFVLHVGGFAFGVGSGTEGSVAVLVSVLVLFTDRHFSPVNVLLTLLQVCGTLYLSVCLSVYWSIHCPLTGLLGTGACWVHTLADTINHCLMSLCFELGIRKNSAVLCFFGVFPQDADGCGWRCLISGDERRITPQSNLWGGAGFLFSSFLGQRSWCKLILELGTSTLCILLSGTHFASQIGQCSPRWEPKLLGLCNRPSLTFTQPQGLYYLPKHFSSLL